MNTYSIYENFLELNQIVADELIKTYHDQPGKQTLLTFPLKRDGKKRISEQELRIAMITLFSKNNYLNFTYSVEAPTLNMYSFKGTKSRSASTDLAFYDGGKRILNIELKAHNPSQHTIDKDIEKLVSEDCLGAWCHIFENDDSGTIQSMFNKLQLAMDKAVKKYGSVKNPIYFSFLVLKNKKLITRKGLDDDLHNFNSALIFDLKYAIHQKIPTVNQTVGNWHINTY